MVEPNRDLWPVDLGGPSIVPPVAILREQASLLATRTKGLLVGEVVSRPERHAPSTKGYPFLHEFRIRAPAFGDYRYSLFDVRHDFSLYPLTIRYYPSDQEFEARSEDQFLSELKDIFALPRTRQIVDALLAQIEQPSGPSI